MPYKAQAGSNAKYTLTPAEVRKLIFHCEDLRERIIIRLMVHCGMRREEVAGVKVEKIDVQRRRISFLGKGRLSGIVPVPPEVLQDIKFFLAGRTYGYLFPAKKKKNSPIALVQINRIVSDVGKRAGLKSPNPKSGTGNINPHLLRHTYARLLKDADMSVEEVQNLMRHRSFNTTYSLYGTLQFDEVQSRYETRFLEKNSL